MHNFMNRHILTATAAALAGGAGVAYAATSSGETSDAVAPRAAPNSQLATAPADAVGALTKLRATQGVDVNLAAARVIPGPGRATAKWVIAPTSQGGACGSTGEVTFCGLDRASVESGRASATVYPPDTVMKDAPAPEGMVSIRPSDEAGVRSGAAPSGTSQVVVVDKEGRVLKETAVDNDVYQIDVPAQQARAKVRFLAADGSTLAERPAEG